MPGKSTLHNTRYLVNYRPLQITILLRNTIDILLVLHKVKVTLRPFLPPSLPLRFQFTAGTALTFTVTIIRKSPNPLGW